MLRIRLSRKGKKKQPQYRVVVADVKFKRDGRFVENIGFYNPLTDPPTVEIREDRALYWLSVGAQPSDPVKHLLQKQGTYDRLKRLHQGEELDALAAEFSGPSVKEAVKEAPPAKAAKSKAKVEPAAAEAEEASAAEVEDTPAAEAVVEEPAEVEEVPAEESDEEAVVEETPEAEVEEEQASAAPEAEGDDAAETEETAEEEEKSEA